MASEWNVNRIYLMMGKACNFRCRHCVQEGQIKDNASSTTIVDEKVFGYLEHLTAIRPDCLSKLNMMFWGGEPLLYMDVIKSVIARMGDKLSYSIVSNGELLTKELVEFFNVHGVRYILSNDGKHTARVRCVNMLDDPAFRALFNSLEKRGIDSVISAYNQNYYDLWAYLDRLCPDTPVFTEPLMVNWPMPEDLYGFDLQAYEEHLREIAAKARVDVLAGVYSPEVELLQVYTKRLMNHIKLSKNGEGLPPVLPKCGQMRTAVNIDLNGQIHACHNFDLPLGTVEDDFDVLVTRYDELINKTTADSECKSCECLPICRYGCPFTPESEGKQVTCAVTKIFIGVCMEYIASFAGVLSDVEIEC